MTEGGSRHLRARAARIKRIGIDFDNTLLGYDQAFLTKGLERKLLAEGFSGSKQAVRDAIRLLPGGEILWQELQGYVYGKGIGGAVIFDGVKAFLREAHAHGHSVFIVSHKTEFGHHDPERINLREVALSWIEAQGLFDKAFGIARANIFFETTREEKLKRIAALGCTHFIDDLPEVLTDPGFPSGVERILFGRSIPHDACAPIVGCEDWHAVNRALMNDEP
jgi:hypothetical protein